MSVPQRNRILDRLQHKETVTARHERLRHAYKTGEYIDEFTTTNITPQAQKLLDKILDRFLYGDKK